MSARRYTLADVSAHYVAGGIECTALFGDGGAAYLEHATYYGYSLLSARRAFRDRLNLLAATA